MAEVRFLIDTSLVVGLASGVDTKSMLTRMACLAVYLGRYLSTYLGSVVLPTLKPGRARAGTSHSRDVNQSTLHGTCTLLVIKCSPKSPDSEHSTPLPVELCL